MNKSKTIIKNTIMLYIRMLLLMAVNLYTSRVVLNALGVSDYGVYNVVGGLVTMFQMISGSLTATISRYITIALGRGDMKELSDTFSSSLYVQIFLGIIVFILAETLGLWYLNNVMNIPVGRLTAANWVFQFSLINFIVYLLYVPFNSLIISFERMSVFAYISLFEAFGKLAIAFSITALPYDRLINYSILLTMLSFFVTMIYLCYCRTKIKECKFTWHFSRRIILDMFAFSGWNFIGASSGILRDNGGNLLVNFFFGTILNTARGISMQVNSAVQGFVSNFMLAMNPQITKSYASGDFEYMKKLIYKGARFSFFLILFIASPIIICSQEIIHIWLNVIPDYSVTFVQLTLLFCMLESFSGPLITVMLATGKIRNYQLIVGGLQLLNLPVSYIFLSCNAMPEIVLIVAIVIGQICLFARLIMLKTMVGLTIMDFFTGVYLRSLIVAAFGLALPVFLMNYLHCGEFLHLLIIGVACALSISVSIFYLGCESEEKSLFVQKARNILSIW